MCKLEAHIHVHCGCTSKTVVLSRCQALRRLPGIGALYCAYKLDTATIKVPAEDFPCCVRCYPAKREEIQQGFLEKRDRLVEKYAEGWCTKKEFCEWVERDNGEMKEQLALLKRPYRRTLRDGMAVGRLNVVDGGKGYR